MKSCREIKTAAVIDAVVHYAETMKGIRFKNVKKIGTALHAQSMTTPKTVFRCMSIKMTRYGSIASGPARSIGKYAN